ncbi:MAG TPA: cation:dicarboxylase symporter family transporter, partial [Dehalococcoidia bacterium]|nr:cation:dicarboxylase symporter family transporter [Dehalococcoidia bacterium]
LLAMVLGMMGVPAEGIAIVLGADRLLDMCRTAVNVTGDLVTAAVVERVEQRRVRSVGDEFAVVTEPGRRASGT